MATPVSDLRQPCVSIASSSLTSLAHPGLLSSHTQKALLLANAKVYLLCRSQSKAMAAIARLDSLTSRTAFFHPLDLSSVVSSRSSAIAFLELEPRIDVLFNNAGLMSTSPSLTSDGVEVNWGVNTLGPWVFTREVLPALLRVATESGGKEKARVIWTSSSAAENMAPKEGIVLDGLRKADGGRKFDSWSVYGQVRSPTSWLALVL